MKKKIILAVTTICCIIVMFIVLHITPTLGLRTYLFMEGYPIVSLSTGIVDDEPHNTMHKEILKSQNAKCYTLTKPAFDKPTQSKLRNFKVTKKGILYFAEYYGEV